MLDKRVSQAIAAFLAALIAGCGADPKETTQNYLQAVAALDTVTFRQISCQENIPQALDWSIMACGQATVVSNNFLKQMATIEGTLDTLGKRCDSLKTNIRQNFLEVNEEDFHQSIMHLKSVCGSSGATKVIEDSRKDVLVSYLKFPVREVVANGKKSEFELPNGQWVTPQEALSYIWDTGAFTYHNNKQIVNILTIRHAGLKMKKDNLECALGRSVNHNENVIIEQSQCLLEVPKQGEENTESKIKYDVLLMRANRGKWVVTGLVEHR